MNSQAVQADWALNKIGEIRTPYLVEIIRVLFLTAILFVALALQMLQPAFINLEILQPLLGSLFIIFSIHAVYLSFYEKLESRVDVSASIFAIDAVFITTLTYVTGANYSIFLFLYLVNIILCGLSFKKTGGFLLAAWSSVLFSSLLVVSPLQAGQTLFFALIINNIAFFSVAYVAGYLSDQLASYGERLSESRKDLSVLKDLNSTIIENMASGLLTVNIDGKVLAENSRAREILGGSLEGQSLLGTFPRLSPAKLEKYFVKNLKNLRYEFNLPQAQAGVESLLEVRVSAIRDGEETVIGFILIF